MASSPSAAFLRLRHYIVERMRMSHIYQPLMLLELLGRRSPAPAWRSHYATNCLSSAGRISTHSEAIGMQQALFFGLMEKAESSQDERESRSDRDDNPGWRRCRCSWPPSRSKAQRETV